MYLPCNFDNFFQGFDFFNSVAGGFFVLQISGNLLNTVIHQAQGFLVGISVGKMRNAHIFINVFNKNVKVRGQAFIQVNFANVFEGVFFNRLFIGENTCGNAECFAVTPLKRVLLGLVALLFRFLYLFFVTVIFHCQTLSGCSL